MMDGIMEEYMDNIKMYKDLTNGQTIALLMLVGRLDKLNRKLDDLTKIQARRS